MTTTCSNCQFGHAIPYKLDDGTDGKNTFCRWRPPEFIPPNGSVLKPVAPDGWCGQWAAQPMKPVKRGKAS